MITFVLKFAIVKWFNNVYVMKQLALDTQSFERLRKNESLYVDKTGIVHRMISEGWMRLPGFKIREHNNLGRSDLVWEQPNLTVVAEIKDKPDAGWR
jgi:hypothetical protein